MGDVEKRAKSNIDTINDYVEAAKRLEMSEEDITAIRNKASELQKELVGDLRDLFYPLSDIEEQTKANLDVINDYAAAGKQLGMSEIELGQIEWYRNKVANDLVQSANAMTSSMGEMEKQARQNRDTLNEHKRAAEMAGASTAQLAEIENNRTKLQNQFMASVDATLNPLSDVEQQTKATLDTLRDHEAALRTLGAASSALAQIEEARATVQSGLLDQARALVFTTPEIVSQTDALKTQFENLRNAMILAGASAEDLAELQRLQAQAVDDLQRQYRASFTSDYVVRQVEANGQDTTGLRLVAQQQTEIEEVIQKFGEGSKEYYDMLSLHRLE